MSTTKVCATVSFCAQVGMDQWRDINRSCVFETTATLSDILTWANRERNSPKQQYSICDIKFSTIESP